jgi:hypothetical protein
LTASATLTSTTTRQVWARPPIDVDFEVLMFTASGLIVRFLKVFEKSNYQSIKWVRYLTKAEGSYQVRVCVTFDLLFLNLVPIWFFFFFSFDRGVSQVRHGVVQDFLRLFSGLLYVALLLFFLLNTIFFSGFLVMTLCHIRQTLLQRPQLWMGRHWG